MASESSAVNIRKDHFTNKETMKTKINDDYLLLSYDKFRYIDNSCSIEKHDSYDNGHTSLR